MAALLLVLLSLGATPARADLAGICAAAGASSDCVNKPQLGGRGSDGATAEPREPACDADCRRARDEEERRILDAVPPAVETRPLEPDPAEETDWHFAKVSEADQEIEPRLANANLLVLSVVIGSQPELWVPAAAFAVIWYVGTQTQLPQMALSEADRILRKARARLRPGTQECRDTVAGKKLFCDKYSCTKGVGDCDDARLRLIKSRMCLAMRENTRDICHGGIDTGNHPNEVLKARDAVERCEDKVAKLCDCRDDAKSALLDSARRLCGAAPDCSNVFDCGPTLALLKSLQFCRFALKNVSLRCPGEESGIDMNEITRKEADCRATLVRRCGQIVP